MRKKRFERPRINLSRSTRMKNRPETKQSLLARYNCGPVKLSGDSNAPKTDGGLEKNLQTSAARVEPQKSPTLVVGKKPYGGSGTQDVPKCHKRSRYGSVARCSAALKLAALFAKLTVCSVGWNCV